MPRKPKKLVKRVSLRFYEGDAKLLKKLEKQAKQEPDSLNNWILRRLKRALNLI